MILTKEIRNIIDRNGPNRLYMVSDFAHLNLENTTEEGLRIVFFISLKKKVKKCGVCVLFEEE